MARAVSKVLRMAPMKELSIVSGLPDPTEAYWKWTIARYLLPISTVYLFRLHHLVSFQTSSILKAALTESTLLLAFACPSYYSLLVFASTQRHSSYGHGQRMIVLASPLLMWNTTSDLDPDSFILSLVYALSMIVDRHLTR